MLQGIGQRSILKVSHWMGDNSGGLIMILSSWIFVDDRQFDVDRFQKLFRRLNQPERHSLISEHTLISVNWKIIDIRHPGRHHAIQTPRRIISQMLREERINSIPRRYGSTIKSNRTGHTEAPVDAEESGVIQ